MSTLTPSHQRQRAVIAANLAATVIIFGIDISLPRGYVIAYAYILVVLGAALGRITATVAGFAGLSITLTLVAYFIKRDDVGVIPHGTLMFGRIVAVILTALAAALAIAMIVRDRKTLALDRALRSAEIDREVDRRMLAAASELAAIGTWSINEDDDRFDWSDAAALMHGRAPGYRPTREQVLALMVPEDAERLSVALDLAQSQGVPFREEIRVLSRGGGERWLVKMGEALTAEDGSVVRLHGTVQDITRWKRAELSATTLHHRFTRLTKALPIIVWTATPTGAIDFFNEALVRYTGLTEGELLADNWMSVLHPDDVEMVNQRWSEAIATGSPYEAEFRIRGADGSYRWHRVAAQCERDEHGEIVRWWGSATDIDATRALRERTNLLLQERETIMESMKDGLYALDQDYRILYANQSAEAIFGRTDPELIGHVIWDIFPGSEKTDAATVIVRAMEDGTPGQLTYFSDILDKWLDLSVTRSAVGVTVFLRDVTEVKALSERLGQSQRLEAVGQLTGGIAHDFNNLLTVVLGGADALMEDEGLSADGREMAAIIGQAAQRGAELTHRLLAFSRKQPLEPHTVDLAQRLRDLEPLLRRTIGEDISMAVLSPDEGALALVDPTQYDNAVLNLAINARDAMAGGGSLTIEVGTATLDESYATAHAEVTPGTYAVTTVTDSGDGIPPEVVGKLFDPFFTTKRAGKGSGLGLAMVWGFVKQSNGHITVYSEPEYGTSFKLYLPASSAPLDVSDEAVSAPRAQRVTSGTILIAEDDHLVRTFAASQLRAHGYEVVDTSSGPEALEALESMERLDLLFTDVIMPGGMTGRALADAVLAQRPGTPVLYTSGYTENVILHNGRLDAGVRLLAKPYSARQLLDLVGQVMSKQGTEA